MYQAPGVAIVEKIAPEPGTSEESSHPIETNLEMFAFNSSKKFSTRINSYPASRLATVSNWVGDPRLVEAVGDSHRRSLAQSFAVALV